MQPDPKRVADQWLKQALLKEVRQKLKKVWDDISGKEIGEVAHLIENGYKGYEEYKRKPQESEWDWASRLDEADKGGAFDDLKKTVRKRQEQRESESEGKGREKALKQRYEKYRKSLKDPRHAQSFREWAQKQ